MSIILNPQIRKSIVTLTDAQIKALPTTSIELVAAPGSGSRILFLFADLNINAAAGAYTNISNDGYIYIGNGAADATSGYIANDNTLTSPITYLTSFLSANHKIAYLQQWQSMREQNDWGLLGAPYLFSGYDNATLELFAINAAGNYTGGNAANSLIVSVYYVIL